MKINKTLLVFFSALLAFWLAACAQAPAPAPAATSGDGIVRAILFWTPGCSSCETVLRDTLPPLEARYGSRFQLLRVPLNNLDEVNRLYAAADFFKLKKEDVQVPFVVIGSGVLTGEMAVERELNARIQAGFAAGGYAQAALPPPQAELAARPTPTPRPTLAPLLNEPGAFPAQPTSAGACVVNTPCPPTPTK